ncbi:hypothetical protein NONI108955_10835 [Nocardia ninae]|uniref:Uncharacterized protein n=1 Tax=Nocardia ninae NBRC 108245 TaxID=1210091 RepID=A0A511MJ70_9NOCA|nr:hypothetical protein NN4_44950 [Nocardia ninae NBRC 108245]
MHCRPAHLVATGAATFATLLAVAPAANAETSPSYRCKTITPGKAIGDNLAPVEADKCTAANKAPKAGEINGFFFILDSAKKGTYFVCGVKPDGKLAAATEETGAAALPGKVTADGCMEFPKGDFKFTPEQFEQELAKQAKKMGTPS